MREIDISSVAGATGDASFAVTSLTITPSNTTSGSTVTMDLTFADQSGDINPGDTIDVTWPSTGNAYLEGYNQTFPLIDKKSGLTLANVVVTDGEAKITFTDDIGKLQDITGSVTFKAIAWNVTEGYTEDNKTINIICGTKTASITITKPEAGGGKADFYYKTGSVWANDPDHVHWYLNCNVEREYVYESVSITDQLQLGQEIESDDFRIYNSTNTESYSGINAIEEFEKEHPNSYIYYNVSSGTINISLDPNTVNGVNWIIVVKTKITDKSQGSIKNNSSINYWPEGSSEPKSIVSNASVESPYADGNISGVPIGTLMIKKFIEDSNGNLTDIPLGGIKFKLVGVYGGEIIPGETSITLITNAQGEAKIENIADGEYQLTEEDTPNWLNPLAGSITINVDSSTGKGVLEIIGNTKKTIDVTANKIWDSSEQAHPTIWLKLYRSSDSGTPEAVMNEPIKELPSGITNVTWTGVDYSDNSGNVYTYSVQEVNAQGEDYTPVGYSKIESGLTVTNKTNITSITVNKVWEDSNDQGGIRPDKIIVSLKSDGVVVGNPVEIKGNNWTYTWSNLPVYKDGKKIDYTITEVPSDGYESTVSYVNEGLIIITNTNIVSNNQTSNNQTFHCSYNYWNYLNYCNCCNCRNCYNCYNCCNYCECCNCYNCCECCNYNNYYWDYDYNYSCNDCSCNDYNNYY